MPAKKKIIEQSEDSMAKVKRNQRVLGKNKGTIIKG